MIGDPKSEKKPKKKRGYVKKLTLKQIADKARYRRDSKAWLVGKSCACRCGSKAAIVHLKRGDKGYADSEKFILGIKLLHDQDFWLPVCLYCHGIIEMNPTWAHEEGYSESRGKMFIDNYES